MDKPLSNTWVLFYKKNNDQIFLQEQSGNLHDAKDHVHLTLNAVTESTNVQEYKQKLTEHKDALYVLYKGNEFKLYD